MTHLNVQVQKREQGETAGKRTWKK